MSVVSFCCQKGGTGKTTSAVMISACLALQNPGKKVLLIDMDPQASATECLIAPRKVKHDIGDLLLKNSPKARNNGKNGDSQKIDGIGELIISCDKLPGLDFIPSSTELLLDEHFGIFTNISSDELRLAIEPIRDEYSYIIIDCPPNLLHFTKNALLASDYVVIPMPPEPLAYDGAEQFIDFILPEIWRHNNNIRLGGVLFIHNSPRKHMPELIRNKLDEQGDIRFKTEVHKDQNLAKMATYHEPICVRSKACQGSKEFHDVTREFTVRVPS